MRDFIGEWRLHCGTNSVRLFGSSRPRSAETLYCIKQVFVETRFCFQKSFLDWRLKGSLTMAKVQALQNTLQASFQPQWWHRVSVRNFVVLCHTILVSRYRYRNFFKRAYVSLQERPHYFGIECDALEGVELKKCVSLWGELVSVGEWVFTAERCVMLRTQQEAYTL